MTTIDLLDTVLPEEGWFAVLGIKGKSVRQKLVQTRKEVDEIADKFVAEERNVFFGLAKFETGKSREQDNVKALKAFWLDIDCGEGKAKVNPKTGRPDGYIDQATGMQELKKFCDLIGLPTPIIVDSGRGLHVYWPLTNSVSRNTWEPVARRFRELCIKQNFYVDPSVFEASRVLRIPGTYNFKESPALEVGIIMEGAPVEFDKFKEILGVSEAVPVEFAPSKSELNEFTKSLLGNKIQRFKNIMIRGENGCKQLNYAYENQDSISEPLWWSALTVANVCVDREVSIHMMSSGHPDYSYEATEAKANQQKEGKGGPHTCATFEKHNPGGCDGCKWKGKITGPVALSSEINEAKLEDNTVEIEEGVVEVIPEYPKPFLRGAMGGIYMPPVEEAEPICVYEHDLYVLKLMTDPTAGAVALMKLHLPHDGTKEFVVPLSVIAAPEELKKELATKGVACTPTQMKYLANFVMSFVKNLQYKRKSEIMRTQFGWADKDSKFIIGDREISKDGTYGSPASSETRAIAQHMVPCGTFEEWYEVFNMYSLPGLEPHAFAALTAFGAPLFKFTGLKGAIINVIYKFGGTGKSTTLFMCNSVYGHPESLSSVWKDTNNAKMQRLGTMNNLPYTIDEITNITPADFSDLAYGMSQGRAKDRMKGATNELRENNTTWQTMSLASANASFYEKLGSAKAGANAEMLRLFEYTIPPTSVISTEDGKRLFDRQLKENYGHAGDIYVKWLVDNLEDAVQGILDIQRKIDAELKLTPPERFWSAVAACNLAGGVLAKRLGLHDYNMAEIYKWTCKTIQGMREEIKPPAENAVAVVGDYINRHMQNILVVKADVDKRSTVHSLPTLEPKGELLIRYEPDTKLMYLVTREFKHDCVERQTNYKDTLKELESKGFFKGANNKRMSKGMKITSPAVATLMFDCSTGLLDMDGLIAPEIENVSRETELPH
jgi:hypothetical protein